jgi:hypothetical protein
MTISLTRPAAVTVRAGAGVCAPGPSGSGPAMTRGITRGALAGAAGTTALNAVTYLDMALRARPASDSTEQLVQKAADRVSLPIPGDQDERGNRVQGLGPLSGIAVGVAVGAVAGLVRRGLARSGRSLPPAVEAPLIGAVAMALSDVPLKLLGISDPASWAAADWASDAIPHLLYGVVTSAVLRSGPE